MNDVPLFIALVACAPVAFAVGCFVYPLRPQRFARLFYARWQRQDSRRVEIAVMWPLGCLSALVGILILLDLSGVRDHSTWPVLVALCALVAWSVLVTASAWARRLPSDHE